MKSTNNNVYFTFGTSSEQNLIEDLIIESIKIYGNKMFYIPRTLISKDEILGEDRLSEFNSSYPIEMYFENVDNFEGQGFMLQKFGMMVEQSATLVVARKRWNQLIGKYGVTILPNRPCEGDLIYFPLSKGLFEIKFVQHQDPFYQLGKLYVYKLQVELFQYASEKINTGMPELDVFQSLKTFDTDPTQSAFGAVKKINVIHSGSGYTSAELIISGESGFDATASAVISDGKIVSVTITNPGYSYSTTPLVVIQGDGIGAELEAVIHVDIDKPDSYGDNNQFLKQAETIVQFTDNPFGDINV